MRKHFLSDLEIDGREKVLRVEPHFVVYKVKRARAMAIDFEDGVNGGGQPSLVLNTDYKSEPNLYNLIMRFDGIRELALPEMRPYLYLDELEIEDVRDRMLEGVRFEVVSCFDYSFRCVCQGIVIVSFDPVS